MVVQKEEQFEHTEVNLIGARHSKIFGDDSSEKAISI